MLQDLPALCVVPSFPAPGQLSDLLPVSERQLPGQRGLKVWLEELHFPSASLTGTWKQYRRRKGEYFHKSTAWSVEIWTGTRRPAGNGHLNLYEGLSMSGSEEAKRDAEQQVSKELANQPKQDGPEKEESKDRRADAEEKLTK
jgi:hypothetical protein